MVRIYYHIYGINGVESIFKEQIDLIENHFNFPYILNAAISLDKNTQSIYDTNIIQKLYAYNKPNIRLRDIGTNANEFLTLNLIEKDKDIIGNNDYILYIHTKGASRLNQYIYKYVASWRQMMQYFLIEKHQTVFSIFEKTDFNTCGILLHDMVNRHYSGNFWWAKGDYIKTLNTSTVDKSNRYCAESHFIQMGDWKPYSLYNADGSRIYNTMFKRDQYAK